ncbi:hypothetical protein DY245_21310 [Streptomyces inhibens]|uniref:WXG100 family type VII secretion target n=1 Tax=Streptomyces inhibens TaxID=2293571 RepID=A0A371Q235_STRIH|nr:hypothetical protein [Streptomyces inhibens]REK88423.1 hypothetical protein DY245_21310 [Streptomyces inhibens]
MSNPYPHLGFNPVPGSLESVSALHTKLTKSVSTLDSTQNMVHKIEQGTYWEGDAAVAFREELGKDFDTNLRHARDSIGKAATAISGWYKALSGFHDRARTLDNQAKAARERLGKAEKRQESAAANPDLKLAGQTFTDQSALDSAQARLDKANSELTDANSELSDAKGDLQTILNNARELQEEHTTEANRRAAKLREATDKLAPEEPGWFENALSWVWENKTDILGAVAAIAGIVALFATGPVGVAFLLAAGAASLAAAGTRVADPKFRASMADAFTKGEFDKDFWNNAVGIAGDMAGAIPFGGVVARGATGAFKAAAHSAEALTLADRLVDTGKTIWTVAGRTHAPFELPTEWTVRAAAGVAKEVGVPIVGGASAIFGVAKNIDEDLKKAEDGALIGDAIRVGGFDIPGSISSTAQIIAPMFR